MLTERTGDLLSSDAQALVNAVNCAGVMGKGIALEFKRRFPANYAAYRDACAAGEVRLGSMFVVRLPERVIINFPTKRHWRSRSRLADLEAGLADLARVIEEQGLRSVAVPALGAGHGGLAWADVEPLIRRALAPLTQVTIELYSPRTVTEMAAQIHTIGGSPNSGRAG